jgi:CHAT domain-containing protein/tetratricopeptide (TPR) repeat protein
MARLGPLRAVAAACIIIAAGGGVRTAPVAPQDPATDAKYQPAYTAGQQAFGQKRYADALVSFQTLLTMARVDHSEFWEGRALYGIGGCERFLGKPLEARATLLQALAIQEDLKNANSVGVVRMSLAFLAEATSAPDEAVVQFRAASTAFDAAGSRESKLTADFDALRIVDNSMGEDQANAAYQTLREGVHALGPASELFEGQVLHSWGDWLFNFGDYDAAITKLDEAGRLSKSSPSESGTIYNSLGRVFRVHGQYAAALQCQLQALALLEKSGTPHDVIQGLNAVAVAYQFVGNDAQARTYYERALAAAEKSGDHAYITFMRANYGSYLVDSGEHARGRELIAQTIADTPPYQLSRRFVQLADADRQLGRSEDSLREADESLKTCAAGERIQCVFAHIERANTNLALGHDQAALEDQQTALHLIEDSQSKLASQDFLKQGFDRFWQPSYTVAVELELRAGKIKEALETAERGRSRALLDLLASRDLGQPAPAPVSTLTLRGTSTTSVRSNAVAQSATFDGLSSMAARLHSTLLLYWVGQDKIYEWVLTPDGKLTNASVKVSLDKLASLIRATTAFADETAGGTSPTTRTRGQQSISLVMKPQAAWRELYDLLIQPVAASLPTTAGARLTIVPHGPLINVPFAALKDAQGRYLIERYALHSLTAGAMLDYTKSHTSNPRAGSMLLVADPSEPPTIPGEPPLPRLPGAQLEVRAIAALLPSSRATVLDAADATEPRVVKATSRQTVLHFATHAIVRDGDPLSSFLALGRTGDASVTGRLTAEKIYRLKLDANLVVLSACRSGEGVPNGDGIAALARAFFYAGTSSLIVSLWDIADEPTNRLLPAFYKEWLKGTDKARALRAAQLQLLGDLRAGRVKVSTAVGEITVPEDPAFWASFVLLGDPE